MSNNPAYSIERARTHIFFPDEPEWGNPNFTYVSRTIGYRPRLSQDDKTEIINSVKSLRLSTPTVSKGWWFITIRPDTTKICFFDFWNEVKKILYTTLYSEYFCSFEQKSLTAPLGLGFHCHIIAKSTYWKSQQLQKLSKFHRWCNPACINIDKCFDHTKLLQDYLISYASDDNHKAETQEPDRLWRSQWGMKHIYTCKSDWLHSLSSPV